MPGIPETDRAYVNRTYARMRARYPGWPPETRESVYHHLCALDLF